MKRYNPKEIEPKWQKKWDEQQTYRVDLSSDKPKYYAMSMLNYPSGAGIHIGHAMNYTISDVMARFKRQQGYESYHPVGWDAFGLPVENYAIKTGVSPQKSMAEIIPHYHKQYKAMGWSNDWSKEISTHEPEYYKWTQWIFSQLYKNGLVYQACRMQWWCPIDNTVLADEQVTADGKCWRHDGPNDPPVQKKEIKQWFFKITNYAEELLEAIKDLDWTESVKAAQENWIGKSQGAEIRFEVEGKKKDVVVFTTRPDTIFGATFLVLAPEHELVQELTTLDCKGGVEAYKAEVAKKTDVQRQANKEKTGVFTGSYAINPANNKKVPIWISEYVLTSYGTGAIMAVPAHDERDNEFAKKFDLPIFEVVRAANQQEDIYTGEGVMINSGKYDGMESSKAREKIIAALAKKGAATEKTTYRLRDWSVSRQRYWGAPIPIIHCAKCGPQLVPDEDLPVVLPELADFEPSGDGRSALAKATDWLRVKCPKCGNEAERETDTIDTYVDSAWYFLRYLDPRNDSRIFEKSLADKWMPLDFYNGADHATAHMIYARFITRFFNKIGLIDHAEPFKRFLFNGKVVDSDGKNFSKSRGNGPDPLDIIADGYGADALRTYLMFAAPLDQWVRWDPKGVPGTYRFLNRVWNLVQEFTEAQPADDQNDKITRTAHKTIKKVTQDLEHQRYNTAIAAMMACTNDFYLEKAANGFKGKAAWQFGLESLVQLAAPFAPHIAEELWHDLGHDNTIHADHWPKWDDKLITEEMVVIAVQVNGKLRGEIQLAPDANEETAVAAAKEKVSDRLDGSVKKIIYVPGRIVNLVT